MGLDAFVRCRCLEEGRTTDPPCPRDWLLIDDGVLSLVDEHDDDHLWMRLRQWTETCCDHRRMHLADEWVSNWPGVRMFQEILRELGVAPTVLREIPDGNGGTTSPGAAATCAAELRAWIAQGQTSPRAVLRDADTGEEIFRHIASYDGEWRMIGPRWRVGLDDHGLFVRDLERADEPFRSTAFRQEGAIVVDEETGRRWRSPFGPAVREEPAVGRFRVTVEAEGPQDYEDLLERLLRLFDAAAEAGTPVYWC